MATHWLNEGTISNFQIDNRNLISRIKTMNSILNRIVPDVDKWRSQMSMDINYSDLRELVKDIRNLPDMS